MSKARKLVEIKLGISPRVHACHAIAYWVKICPFYYNYDISNKYLTFTVPTFQSDKSVTTENKKESNIRGVSITKLDA